MQQAGCSQPIVADKWSLTVLLRLAAGPRRFTELKRAVDGISQRMLTVTLRNLERDGLVTRTIHEVMPPNISYALTPAGVSLLAAAEPLMRWRTDHAVGVANSRAEYDER